jgi:hypothetical protein
MLPAITRQLILAILDTENRPAGTPLWCLSEWLDQARDTIRPWMQALVEAGDVLEVMPDRYVVLHTPVGHVVRTLRPVLLK